MKKILVFAICLFGCASLMHANFVPGYMGKRLSVGVNVSSFPFFDEFQLSSDLLLNTRFSYKSELALNYTVGRKASLGFSFYYGKQKYKPGPDQSLSTGGYGYYVEPKDDDFIHCRLMIYEVNLKLYRKNFIAPIGPYHQIGIGVVKYNAVAPGDTIVLVDQQYENRVATVDVPAEPYSCIKLSYHIGYAAPVFKDCYFNFALGINFFRGGDSSKIKYGATTSNYLLSVMNRNLRLHNLLEFKFGFGWLTI